eukprot:COSAG06_NODE_447_length_15632_cov_47.212193_5_plen_1473_part_00
MSKRAGEYRELPSADEPPAPSTPSRTALRERVEAAEARAAAARAEAARFDEAQRNGEQYQAAALHQEPKLQSEPQPQPQPEPQPEPHAGTGATPSSPAERELQRTVARMQREIEQLKTPRSVQRGSVSESSVPEAISRHEHEEALAEVAKLRQVVTSAKAVSDDEKLLRVLSTVEDAGGEYLQASGVITSLPSAPADRTLRQTTAGTGMAGGLYFTPDAQTLVHGGRQATELSLWDLRSRKRTNGGVKRSAAVLTSAVSPDGQLLCVAAMDGLAMFAFSPRSSDGEGGVEEPHCEPLWEIATGTRFAGVAFSRDSRLVAAVRWETGQLEIRDARSNSAVKVIEDFPAGGDGGGHNCLAFSEEVLAVGGRDGKPNKKQVRLYAVESDDFAELATLEVPAGKAHSLAMSPDGTKLAVGMYPDAGAAIFSSANGWGDPPQILSNPQVEPQGLCSTAFSHDGRYLCAGYHPSKQFAIWDVEAAVCVRAIQTNGCFHACAFSPADDLLATAGHDGTSPVLVHELLPRGPLATFALPGEAEQPLSAACASDSVVVLASGKRLAALARSGGKVLWQTDAEVDIHGHHHPMALQPTGGQVAVCLQKLKSVSVRDLQTGKPLFQLGPFAGDLIGVYYSPDGSLIMICGCTGLATEIFSATSGEKLHIFVDKESANIHNCAVDPFGKLLATSGWAGTAFVKELESGKIVHHLTDDDHTDAACFDDLGKRMAFSCHPRTGPEVVLRDTEDWRELWRVKRPRGMGRVMATHFSPGDGEHLLLSAESSRPLAILDSKTGEEPAWSRCFHAMALPPGNIPHCTIRWVTPPPETATADHEAQPSQPLVLQAAVDGQLCLIDVSAFIRSFNEDGNFSLEQLNRLSDSDPDSIPILLEKWPHVVNFRDDTTGDTVLHHCARTGKPEATQKWLSGKVAPAQLENKKARSALREAVTSLEFTTTKEMIRLMDPDMPLARTNVLTIDLVAIGETFPRDVVDFIQILQGGAAAEAEPKRFQLFHRQKKLSLLNKQLDTTLGYAVRASVDGRADEPWPEFLGEDASVKCESELLVLMLGDFAGMPSDGTLPPYTRLYQACEDVSEQYLNALMLTDLMNVVTDFKWHAYCKNRVHMRLVLYCLHFVLAAAAMVMSTQFAQQNEAFHEDGGWTGDWSAVDAAMSCDVLQGALLLSNSVVFYRELNQVKLALMEMRRRVTDKSDPPSCWSAARKYLSSGWNCIDVAGILALYGAAAAHMTDSAALLQGVGSLGVLLNAFSLLQLLTPFEATGPLIKTVIEIMRDISGYVVILLVLLWGFSVSFAVAMPENAKFVDDNAGPLVGLLTSFEAIVGSFHMSDFQNSESTGFFLLYLFGMVVIMLNLLIAIMADSYEKVKESEVVEARKLRAQTIIDEEALMSDADRQNPTYFPKFLQVLRATEGKEEVWAGLSGKMVSEIMKVEEKMKENHEAMNAEVASVKSDVAELKAMITQLLEQTR